MITKETALEHWGPLLKSKCPSISEKKLAWLSIYCHNHATWERADFTNQVETLLPIAIRIAERLQILDLIDVVPTEMAEISYKYSEKFKLFDTNMHTINVEIPEKLILRFGNGLDKLEADLIEQISNFIEKDIFKHFISPKSVIEEEEVDIKNSSDLISTIIEKNADYLISDAMTCSAIMYLPSFEANNETTNSANIHKIGRFNKTDIYIYPNLSMFSNLIIFGNIDNNVKMILNYLIRYIEIDEEANKLTARLRYNIHSLDENKKNTILTIKNGIGDLI